MLQKVVEYKIISVRRLKDLEKAVNTELGNGWVPSGPVIITDDNEEYAQVMVKFGEA